MARKMIVANWKEHPVTLAEAKRLFGATAKLAARERGVETVVCPPFVFLAELAAAKKKGIALGAQDVFWEEKGPFTGAVGPKMLRALGAEYVIIGHSERRKWFGETDAMLAKKARAAAAAGLKVIFCIGEHGGIRKKGMPSVKRYLAAQLTYGLKRALLEGDLRSIAVAYEPVWAIGSGKNDDPGDAADIAAFIKATVRHMAPRVGVKVLYGGSVNGRDVRGYVQSKEIDGALVGGASLKADELKQLMHAVGE